MRCPKCQYIGFDSADRCRNCGYEFSLVVDEEPTLDVTITRDDPSSGALPDLSLAPHEEPVSPGTPVGAEQLAEHRPSGAIRRPLGSSDLPLFTDRIADDQAPLVTPPAVPRPPLSVRRTNPAGRQRGRSTPEELSFDLARTTRDIAPAGDAAGDAGVDDAAGVLRRLGAGLIDSFLLGGISAAVVYLTLRICDLTIAEWHVLPPVPLVAFLLLLCGGYFVLFTAAGGQTIGKMVTGIRVVAASEGPRGHLRVSFGAAMVRAIACLGSVLALGAGFIPVLLRADRRAFHDRVAETRVVVA